MTTKSSNLIQKLYAYLESERIVFSDQRKKLRFEYAIHSAIHLFPTAKISVHSDAIHFGCIFFTIEDNVLDIVNTCMFSDIIRDADFIEFYSNKSHNSCIALYYKNVLSYKKP